MPKDPLTDRVSLGGGYRQFSPILGGFTKHDSASPIGKGGINAYHYVHNNPVNASDPTGHTYTSNIAQQNAEMESTLGADNPSAAEILGEASDIEQDFEDALDILDMLFADGATGIADLAAKTEEGFAAEVAKKGRLQGAGSVYIRSRKVRQAYSKLLELRTF